MSPERSSTLLHIYTFGKLSEAERQELFEAAAADADLYAEMMEADDLRAALESPLERRRLMDALPTRKSERFAIGWLALSWALGGALAGLLVVTAITHYQDRPVEVASTPPTRQTPAKVDPRVSPDPQPARETFGGPERRPSLGPEREVILSERVASDPLQPVFDLDLQRSLAASASLDGKVAAGGQLTFRLLSPADATAWVFVRAAGKSAAAITPPAGQHLGKGQPATLKLRLGPAPGHWVARIVIIAGDGRLYRDNKIDTGAVSGPTAVIDLPFEVAEN